MCMYKSCSLEKGSSVKGRPVDQIVDLFKRTLYGCTTDVLPSLGQNQAGKSTADKVDD